MWTRKNRGNVFVGNLPRDFPDERLAEAFDPYGIVLSASVARDPETGERLRYGFVDIATERAAAEAIAALHGTQVDGCKLNVKPSDKPAKKPPGAGGPRRPTVARAPAPRPSSTRPSSTQAGPPQHQYPEHHYPASRPMRETPRPVAADEEMPVPAFAGEAPANPAERPFQVQVVRRRTPNFQVERRPLPRRV